MEEEFAHDDAVARHVFFDVSDVLEPLVPDRRRNQLGRQALGVQKLLVHAHGEHFLVIGAVEYADAPALGQVLHATPQEVVVQLLGRGRLEGKHLAALRIDTGHDVFDRAVLAGGIRGLKDQKNAARFCTICSSEPEAIAVHYKNDLLIGVVFENKLLRATLTKKP